MPSSQVWHRKGNYSSRYIINSCIRSQLKIHGCTIRKWIKIFQSIIAVDLETTDNMIGGPGLIVQILGSEKRIAGIELVAFGSSGGVDNSPERNIFAVVVQDRSAATLREVIKDHVKAGSIIYTDCWRGYIKDDLEALGIAHDSVNHSYNFVDPETGVHTNHIEGTWRAIKWDGVPVRHRTEEFIDNDLITFIWRRKNNVNLWDKFLECVGKVYFDEGDFELIPVDDLKCIVMSSLS